MKNVSLYIPCFNAEKTLAGCLEAVFMQMHPPVEVVVVDDGSTDKTLEIASAYPVRCIRHKANCGLGAARNTAFNNMHTEFIGSLDADCVADPDWLSRLMRRFDDPGVCGAGGKLMEDRIASVFDLWRSIHMKQYWESKDSKPDFLFGANTVFRREAVLNAGSYDETFRSNYEDVDLSRRLLRSGKLLAYEPEAIVHHLKEDDIFSLFTTFWNWRREYYYEQNFFSDLDNFSGKMKDNVGLANRFLDEDLAGHQDPLLYLDFFLALHHSLMDLEHFIFRDTGANGAKKEPRLSSWLALTDLTFFYHYAGQREAIPSLLFPKESFSLNFFAFILTLNRCIVDKFGGTKFKRLLYKHLLFSIYRVHDEVLLGKLLDLVEAHPDWTGLLKKDHPHLNRCFLQTSQIIKKWLDEQKFRSPNLIKRLADSQEIVELDINKKDLLHEN
jgi:glycosyltransferase involved in cell wall biosynthesis